MARNFFFSVPKWVRSGLALGLLAATGDLEASGSLSRFKVQEASRFQNPDCFSWSREGDNAHPQQRRYTTSVFILCLCKQPRTHAPTSDFLERGVGPACYTTHRRGCLMMDEFEVPAWNSHLWSADRLARFPPSTVSRQGQRVSPGWPTLSNMLPLEFAMLLTGYNRSLKVSYKHATPIAMYRISMSQPFILVQSCFVISGSLLPMK